LTAQSVTSNFPR